MITRLCVFDFDGTLFNSPEPPDWWKDKEDWWFDIASMTLPMLPKSPPKDWWIESTVKAVEENTADESAYVVLLTGRPDEKFSSRIRDLVRQKKLNFDEIHLSDQKDTQAFKVGHIQRILKEYPGIERVDLWEDMVDMVPPYRAAVKEEGLEFKLHEVSVERRKADVKEDEFIAKKVATRFASLV